MKKMFNNLFKFSAILGVVLSPAFAFAQTADCVNLGGQIEFLLCRFSLWLNTLVPILIVLAVLYFIWGVIQYVISKDEEAKTRGRSVMIYGLIGLLVITSVWGLVTILRNTLGIDNGPGSNTISVPCIESPGVDCPQ